MKDARSSVILGSLLGSLAIYGVIAACTSLSGGGDVKDADAQTMTPACAKWQVMIVDSMKAAAITDVNQIRERPYNMPAGWEPFGTWGYDVLARRCAN